MGTEYLLMFAGCQLDVSSSIHNRFTVIVTPVKHITRTLHTVVLALAS